MLLIMLSARTRVRAGTTLVPSTPAVQADNAAASTDGLHRWDTAAPFTAGGSPRRWDTAR